MFEKEIKEFFRIKIISIADCLRCIKTKRLKAYKASVWIMDDCTEAGSFVFACTLLGINVTDLRLELVGVLKSQGEGAIISLLRTECGDKRYRSGVRVH
jgi:hypothetical protein